MNRRRFLAGLGAAVAAVAVATRLGEARISVPASPRIADYLTDPSSWYIKPGQLSELELERMLVAAKRWSDETGKPLTIRPTRVIYGRP